MSSLSLLRFYLDEDAMDADVVRGLRLRGIDVLTAREAGMIRAADQRQLEVAAQGSRVLYSFNVRDYYGLHARWIAEGQQHAGILLGRQRRYSVGEQVRRITHLAATLTAEAMSSRIEFLEQW